MCPWKTENVDGETKVTYAEEETISSSSSDPTPSASVQHVKPQATEQPPQPPRHNMFLKALAVVSAIGAASCLTLLILHFAGII